MDEETKANLAVEHALEDRSRLPESMDFWCMGPGCGNTLRKPRYLKFTTGKGMNHRVTWCWCSQACLDAWNAQWHLPGTRWPRYSVTGELIGFHLPRGRFVSVAEIESASVAPSPRDGLTGE